MKEINFKKRVNYTIDDAINKINDLLKTEGFGVITRIDLHTKFKEKIDKDIKPTVILGACNPILAYEAFQLNPDIASLIPCNVVIRVIDNNLISIEIIKPSLLLDMLEDPNLKEYALDAEDKIRQIMDQI